MTVREWHVTTPVWQAYVEGRLDPAAEASVDAHVVGCAGCREAARGLVAAETTDRLWSRVRMTVSAPGRPRSLAWLERLGVPREDLVLLSASRGLHVPWTVAVVSAFVAALVSGTAQNHHEAWFLLLAPLVPILAVVAAFDATDPIRELCEATPYSKLRLALMRATAALAIALPVTTGLGLLVTPLESLAFVWLLPALGLTSTTLVAMTWMRAWTAGGAVVTGWVVVVGTLTRLDRLDSLTTTGLQLVFAGMAAALSALFVVRTLTQGARVSRPGAGR